MTKLQFPLTYVKALTGGGLGALYVYRDATGRQVVGKFPKDTSFENQQLIDDELRRLQRSQGEHVVELLGELKLDDGRRGFAMELMDGSLADTMRFTSVGCLATIDLLWEAMSGVTDLHSSALGAFHGDLKPPNILYKGSRTKLADFGLARGGVGQTQMLSTQWGGTDGYRPPEGYASQEGDVYSLGATMWAMLVGRHPKKDEALAIKIARHPKLESLVNDMLSRNQFARPGMGIVMSRLVTARAEAKQAGSGWNGLGAALGLAAVVVVGAALLK